MSAPVEHVKLAGPAQGSDQSAVTSYQSTRGQSSPHPFATILLEGLAPDGGLYVPDHYPQIGHELEQWRNLSHAELAYEIIRRFAPDIPVPDLQAIVERTYTPARFGHPDITPITTLEPGLHLLGLSHGPTGAFKDHALQLLAELYEYELARSGGELNILGATSGDTGSAAEEAMRGRANIRVFMLSPHGRMSPFQRAQMYGIDDPHIHNLAIEGNFDQCQAIVKAIARDLDFKRTNHIGSVNSINWARIAAQVVYYVTAYLSVTQGSGQPVSFAVPSGNFGNLCAGHIARQMGLPIRQLILATNENNVLDEFFRTGVYRPRPSAETVATSSPSMDISKASNLERFVFDLVGRDPAQVRELWGQLSTTGQFDLSKTSDWQHLSEFGIVSGTSTHADRIATIRSTWERYGVEIDPHTAAGMSVGSRYRDPDVPLICLETALPVKFAATIVEALGRPPARPARFAGIEDRPQHVTVLPANAEQVKAFIQATIGQTEE
ncbi:threonine synthase [Candidatus Berkelbacteria bacterium]|nr:threonine synthase [Candidatus Berkelbacteria bacterium]